MNTAYGVYDEGGTDIRNPDTTFGQQSTMDNFDPTEWLNQIDSLMEGDPNNELEFAELRNLQQMPASQQQQQQNDELSIIKEHRDDDGYGSQTILVTGIMDSSAAAFEDDFSPFTRERCHTWPSVQRNPDDDNQDVNPGDRRRPQFNRATPFSPPQLASHGSSALSLISESNESLSANGNQSGRWFLASPGQDDKFNHSPVNQKSTAVEQKPPTAAAMGGTYKAGHPSYVELITQAIQSSPDKRLTLSEIYDWMVANIEAFKDQRYLHSSSGWKNSVRHNLSLHSRFKRVKRNGMDKPSWWTVDLTEESKRERNNKRPAKQAMRPRSNTTTAAIYHPPQQQRSRQSQRQIDSNMISSVMERQQNESKQAMANGGGRLRNVMPAMQTMKTKLPDEHMDWSRQLLGAKFDTSNVNQSITVTLSDSYRADGSKEKPDIALTLTVAENGNGSNSNYQSSSSNGHMTTLVNEFRQNTLDESSNRQILRVKTSSGQIQEIAVPVPMPIKVVVRSNKDCQTETEPDILSSGFWQQQSSPSKEVGLANFDVESLMNMGPGDDRMMGSASMISPQQYLTPVAVATPGSTQGLNQASTYTTSTYTMVQQEMVNLPLPDDLAAVDMEDSLDCNIMDILSYELNCRNYTKI